MLRNRLLIPLGVISLLLITLAVSKPFSSTSPARLAGASDLYQRHPVWIGRALSPLIAVTGAMDYSDYAQRHPELIKVNNAVDTPINPDTYYPLPPGKQTALFNAARQTCLNQVHEAQLISRAAKPATYYPLPPGKQTALFNAARQACIDVQLSESAHK